MKFVARGRDVLKIEVALVFAPHVEVQADSELWIFVSEFKCFFERGAGNHQARAGDDAMLMALDDAAVDAGGLTEVVGVDDEISLVHVNPMSVNSFVATRG